MPYPLFSIDDFFNNSTSYSSKLVRNQFTDSGYEDKSSNGRNSVRNIRRINVIFVGITKKQQIESFFNSVKGTYPFQYQPFEDTTESTSLYTCKSFSFKPLGNDTYNFTAELRQVFRFTNTIAPIPVPTVQFDASSSGIREGFTASLKLKLITKYNRHKNSYKINL